MGKDFSRQWTAEELRKDGWIPQDEASECLGLPKGEAISWDYIDSETWGADGRNWVKLLQKYRTPTRNPRLLTPDPRPLATWVTVNEAIQILGVCRETVYRLIHQGRFDCYLSGRKWLLKREDVESRLQENWYAERDNVARMRYRPRMRPYRRDGVPLVSDEAFLLCAPYGHMAVQAEQEKIEEWRQRFRRDNYDHALQKDWLQDLMGEKRALTVLMAAEILEISKYSVYCLIRRGTLQCVRIMDGKQPRILLSCEQVENLARKREIHRRRNSKTPAEWAYDGMRPHIRTRLEAPPDDRLISRNEAAGILDVRPRRITHLVGEGRLFGWQEKPGIPGSRLMLSYNQVLRYATSWDHVRRRAWRDGTAIPGVHKEAPIPGVPTNREEFMEWRHLPEKGQGRIDLNHGEYFSTAQTARELGIHRNCVADLRKRGVLMGYHRRWRHNARNSGGSPWWFYLKEDVWALKLDPEYTARSRRARPKPPGA